MAASASPHTNLLRAALLPALATFLVWMPALLSSIPALSGVDSSESPEPVLPPLLLLALYFVSAPTVALIINWRWPAATNKDRAIYAALPQVFVSPALVWLYVWLEVERGYLERGTSEEAMTSGIGIALAVVTGVILTMLVAAFGGLGAWLAQGTHGSGFGADADNDVAATHAGQRRVGRTETQSKKSLAIAFAGGRGSRRAGRCQPQHPKCRSGEGQPLQ
jgi:hypothetical protein